MRWHRPGPGRVPESELSSEGPGDDRFPKEVVSDTERPRVRDSVPDIIVIVVSAVPDGDGGDGADSVLQASRDCVII